MATTIETSGTHLTETGSGWSTGNRDMGVSMKTRYATIKTTAKAAANLRPLVILPAF
jgi:hypothetical protein